jgi:hypothetical protein
LLIKRIIDAADPLLNSETIPSGTFNPTTNSFNGNGSPSFSGESKTDLNAVFDGLADVNGDWRLLLVDDTVGDTGTIDSLSITFTSGTMSLPAVPVPLPLFGVGAAFAYSRKLRSRLRSKLY